MAKNKLKKIFKRTWTIQLSVEDRILANRHHLVMTHTTPYPPFKQDYIFDQDLKNLKIRLKEDALKEKLKEKKAKEVARKAKTKAKEALKKEALKKQKRKLKVSKKIK